MTKVTNGEYFEKAWFKSKKFIAFLLTEVFMAGVVITAFVTQTIGWPLAGFAVAVVFVMGWTTTLFMGKQAELDMFTRGIAMLGTTPTKFQDKFLEAKKEDVPSEEETPSTSDSAQPVT
jgi:hypothetical protein